MPNVLGLEIGLSTIKAVLMARKGLGGGRILDARILDVRDNEGIGPALQKLAEDKNFAGIPCFVSVPSQDVLFRHVRLPFRDDNRIRKTLYSDMINCVRVTASSGFLVIIPPHLAVKAL